MAKEASRVSRLLSRLSLLRNTNLLVWDSRYAQRHNSVGGRGVMLGKTAANWEYTFSGDVHKLGLFMFFDPGC